MGKRSLIDILAELSDDELKTAVTEARQKRSRSRLDSFIFSDGKDDADDDDDDDDKGKGGRRSSGFFS